MPLFLLRASHAYRKLNTATHRPTDLAHHRVLLESESWQIVLSFKYLSMYQSIYTFISFELPVNNPTSQHLCSDYLGVSRATGEATHYNVFYRIKCLDCGLESLAEGPN